jgi:hypothetical protein
MLPIPNKSIGLLILITSCLTGNHSTYLLSNKWISSEVIYTLTARRNNSHPNYKKYGVNTGRTNCGISNAMSVSSYEGGGRHGHLGLIMTNVKFFAVATNVFLPPENLGPAATIVTRMTSIHIAETGRLHTSVKRVYCTYHIVDQAFKKMIIDALADQYRNSRLCKLNVTSTVYSPFNVLRYDRPHGARAEL